MNEKNKQTQQAVGALVTYCVQFCIDDALRSTLYCAGTIKAMTHQCSCYTAH